MFRTCADAAICARNIGFVLCKKNISYHHQQAERIRADKSWHYFELNTYHDCMWEDPKGVVEILVGERMETYYGGDSKI